MKKIKDNIYMFESKTNVLLYIDKNDCYLIDSGKSIKLKKEIETFILENNLSLKGIINTHCHSDHVANNNISNCKTIYSSNVEKTLIQNQKLQLDILYGGKHPNILEDTFLYSDSFDVKDLEELPNMEYINLSGHSYNMIGVLLEKDILYIGDALYSEEELCGIPYLYDIDVFLNSLRKLDNYKDIIIVSSHMGVINDINKLIRINSEFINKIIDDIINICYVEKTFDEIFYSICRIRNIELNLVNYFLISSTIKNFVSYLIDKQLLKLVFKDYNLYYKQTKAIE